MTEQRLLLYVIVAGAAVALLATLAEHTPRPRLTFWIVLLAGAAVGLWWYLHTSCPACQARADRLRRKIHATLRWGVNH
jgi:Flp pilus assembly protein TadB